MPRVLGGQTECCQRIGHNIRGGCQVFTGSCGEVHNALNAFQHVAGLPARHCHIVHGISCFRGGELGLRAHFPGLIPESVQVIPGCSGYSRDLAHGGIKIGGCLYRGSAKTGDRHGCGHDLLTGAGDGVSESLHLFTGLVDLRQRHTGGRCLFLQAAELLLRLDDFPLQGVIFILTEVAVFKLLFCLFLRDFQRIQFLLRRANSVLQRPLFLGK